MLLDSLFDIPLFATGYFERILVFIAIYRKRGTESAQARSK